MKINTKSNAKKMISKFYKLLPYIISLLISLGQLYLMFRQIFK